MYVVWKIVCILTSTFQVKVGVVATDRLCLVRGGVSKLPRLGNSWCVQDVPVTTYFGLSRLWPWQSIGRTERSTCDLSLVERGLRVQSSLRHTPTPYFVIIITPSTGIYHPQLYIACSYLITCSIDYPWRWPSTSPTYHSWTCPIMSIPPISKNRKQVI